MADHYFKRWNVEASSGNWIRIYPDDAPGTLRNCFFSNVSGQPIWVRDSADTNMAFIVESSTSLEPYGALLDSSRLEARSYNTNTATLTVIGSVSRSNIG